MSRHDERALRMALLHREPCPDRPSAQALERPNDFPETGGYKAVANAVVLPDLYYTLGAERRHLSNSTLQHSVTLADTSNESFFAATEKPEHIPDWGLCHWCK